MKKRDKFGTSLGGSINDAFLKKYPHEICFLCKKIRPMLLLYLVNGYVAKYGKNLKGNKVARLKEIHNHRVCGECHAKLLELEGFYITALKNNCHSIRELSRLKLECRKGFEWYWS